MTFESSWDQRTGLWPARAKLPLHGCAQPANGAWGLALERGVGPLRCQRLGTETLKFDIDDGDAATNRRRGRGPVLGSMLQRSCVIKTRGAALHNLKILRSACDNVVANGHQTTLPIRKGGGRNGRGGKWLAGWKVCSQTLGRTEREVRSIYLRRHSRLSWPGGSARSQKHTRGQGDERVDAHRRVLEWLSEA